MDTRIGTVRGRRAERGIRRFSGRPRWIWVLLLPAALPTAGTARAQEQSALIGKVVSSETGDPLPFASFVLTRLASETDSVGTPAGGAMSMADGAYRIPAAPGTYRLTVSYVGFHPKKVNGVEIKTGPPTRLDVDLTPSTIQTQTIEVRAKALQSSEASLLAKQKRAVAVSDGISAQQISKSTDSNAAEVLQRVTGLSIVGGRYVYVRGLGERYSSTQLNGASIGTPEPNKKVVPLDLFAAGLLDNVVVQKTYTPDQPGEFGGGVVNVNTRDFPGRRIWDFSLSSGYGSHTTGRDFHTYDGGSRDFLGFDDGTREIPAAVRDLASRSKIVLRGYVDSIAGRPGFDRAEITAMGRSFNKTWARRTESGVPAYSGSATYGNEVRLLGRSLGFLGSLSYSHGFKTTKGVQRFYKLSGDSLFAEKDYAVQSSESNVLWGTIGNASYRLNDYNALSLRAMYNRSADDQVRFYEGDNQDAGKPIHNERMQYVERGLLATTVASNHFLPFLGGATLDLRYGYSRANRDEPDRREYTLELDPQRRDPIYDDDEEIVGWDTIPAHWVLATRSPSRGLTRMFGRMVEEERGPEAHLSVPFRFRRLEAKVKTGATLRNRDRNANWRRFWFAPPSSWANSTQRDSVLSRPIEEMLTDERIGATGRAFILTELTRSERDNYMAHGDVRAGYAMVDLPLHRKLRAVAGARLERAVLEVNPYDIFGILPDSLLKRSRLDNTDWLPSLNLTWTPRVDMNARLAYSRTVSRPDLRELSEFSMSDFVDDYEQFGNPDLKRARIHNYDVRLEDFLTAGEMYAAGAFYKRFEDPIEYSIGQGNSGAVYKPVNASWAELYGFEAEARVGLGRLNALLGLESRLLDQFGWSCNYSRIHSQSKLSKFAGGSATSNRTPLEGQSPYVLNLGLYYASPSGRTNLAVLFNKLGRRLSAVGLAGLPDIYEEPRTNLDVTASRRFGPLRMKLAMENILDDEVRFLQKQSEVRGEDGTIRVPGLDRVQRSIDSGRTISLSVSTGA